MGVGGLHDCVVRPMLAAHIREGVELAEVARNVVLVRFASQQAVDDGHDLRTVDLVVSTEGAVAIAVDSAMLGGSLDVRGGPIAVAHIVEVLILGHLFRIFVTQAYPKGYEKAITNTTKEW